MEIPSGTVRFATWPWIKDEGRVGEGKLLWDGLALRTSSNGLILIKEGNYSVKSGYWCLSEDFASPASVATSSYTHTPEAWENIWKARVSKRVKQFI